MITGRLEHWSYDKVNNTIWGNIYDDVRERFWDGAYIHTSAIPGGREKEFSKGQIVKTLNSEYLLGEPFSEWKLQRFSLND